MEIKVYDKLPEEAREIRETVFLVEQGFEVEYDDKDEISVHLVMYKDNNTPVATCRVFKSEEGGVYILGRLAVLKEYRDKNYGSKMIEAAEKYVFWIGGTGIKLHSQCVAKGFYAKCGYREYGEIEYEEFCPHIWMRKDF